MPRTVRDAKLDTRSARSGFKVRREPYWRSLSPGFVLGYRKLSTGGTWIARQYRRTLGAGIARLARPMTWPRLTASTFAQAQAAARAWLVARARCDRNETESGPIPLAMCSTITSPITSAAAARRLIASKSRSRPIFGRDSTRSTSERSPAAGSRPGMPSSLKRAAVTHKERRQATPSFNQFRRRSRPATVQHGEPGPDYPEGGTQSRAQEPARRCARGMGDGQTFPRGRRAEDSLSHRCRGEATGQRLPTQFSAHGDGCALNGRTVW